MNLSFTILKKELSVCKLSAVPNNVPSDIFCSLTISDDEISLIIPTNLTKNIPEIEKQDDGWIALKLCGEFDFSVVGIIAKISELLAEESIPILCVATYNTDYILIKKENQQKAVDRLQKAGYTTHP